MAERSSHGEEHFEICTENKWTFSIGHLLRKLIISHYFDLTYISCTVAYFYIWHERFEHFTSSSRESDSSQGTHYTRNVQQVSRILPIARSSSIALDESRRREAPQGLGEGRGRGTARAPAARRRARHLHQGRRQRQPHWRAESARKPDTVTNQLNKTLLWTRRLN